MSRSNGAEKDRRPTTAQRPIAIDLFAGAGGLSLGFEQAGFDVVVAVESDPVHAAVHKYNFPNCVVLNRDVRGLDKELIAEAVGRGLELHGRNPDRWNGTIDAIIAGPPCQGFSMIGKRDAQEHRNKLVYQFKRLVVELRPRYFVMENVPGMRLGDQEQILHRLVRELKRAGYGIVTDGPQLLNAADFGVPQDRKRLFLVGARCDVKLPDPVVQRRRRRVTVWDAIGDIPDADRFAALINRDSKTLADGAYLTQRRRASSYAKLLMGMRGDATDLSYRRNYDRRTLTSSLRTEHAKAIARRFAKTRNDAMEPISRYHRLPLSGLANTLRAGTGRDHGAHTSARPIHPTRPRVITVREAARLHSFPDWFRFHVTKWHGFREVGNSVPPRLAREVGRTIIDAIGLKLVKPAKEVAQGSERLLTLSESGARKELRVDDTARRLAKLQAAARGHAPHLGRRAHSVAAMSRSA